ncbi:MAG: VWA domain-containing protein [Thermoflexibacter sp.]|nr:VWA domain-containing protein [Thermoflexibacter sp.]
MQKENEILKRWRLILGGGEADGIKNSQEEGTNQKSFQLTEKEQGIDKTLEALYDSDKKGGLGASSPNVARWLGDIRNYFPSSVVKIMQDDALKRLNMKSMLAQPEILESIEPDVHLVANLMSLSKIIPEKTKDTARQVVRKVVEELMKKLSQPMQQAVMGSLNRASRHKRPKFNEMDWNTTIRKNLKHYQADYKTIIPEIRIGYGRKRKGLKEVVLCIDQSGSMGTSVVYSGVFGSVMASLPAITTKMVVFDTSVVDLTQDLQDPVDLLFGVQLGGGTDIHRALTYCQQIITRPNDTILVLITDLYEGGNQEEMRKRMLSLVNSGVQLVCLLALNDDGAPSYDHANSSFLASLNVPVFACTPDQFPDLMAAVISKQDVFQWASGQGIHISK